MEVLYIRRSTGNQENSFGRQMDGKSFDKVYTDTCSGSIPFFERTSVQELIKDIDKYTISTLYVHELSRLGRSLRDILNTINYFTERKIQVVVNKENIKLFQDDGSVSPMTMMMISLLGTFSELERQMILDRQKEGIRISRLKNKYLGRKVGSVEGRRFLDKPKVKKSIELLKENRLKKYEVAKIVGLSVTTITKVSKMM